MKADCASFWTGERLGAIERACLRSAVRVGMDVTLYAYREVAGVPDGVRLADAATVLPETRLVRHQRGSFALFSDLFRFELQRRGLGTWIDCDVYHLAPLDDARPYLFGWEDRRYINGAILRLPPDSPIIPPILAMFDGREVPFWLPWAARLAAGRRLRREGSTDVSRMPWGSAGPKALTALARHHGLDHHALPSEVFYPVPYRKAAWIRDPAITMEQVVAPGTAAIHLWNECIRPYKDQPAPVGSFLARLHEEGR